MNLELEIQHCSEAPDIPSEAHFRHWAKVLLEGRRERAELVLRLVDEEESRQLNLRYRGKDAPTNVLSFPFEAPPQVSTDLLGDLVICAPVVAREAQQQKKVLEHHWAHMLVHGGLHLLGHDHQNDREAEQMEALEVQILARLGLPDPYQTDGNDE